MRRHRKRRSPAWICEAREQIQARDWDVRWRDPYDLPADQYLAWIARHSTEGGRLRKKWSGRHWGPDELLSLMQSGELKLPEHAAVLIQLCEAMATNS